MINVVFCLDENLIRQVRVAVSSLIESGLKTGTHYHVYCICTGNAGCMEDDLRNDIQKRDSEAELTVITVEDAYASAYQVRDITTATYLRLMLPDLLQDVDKIIYVDIDVLFCDSLLEVWNADMDGMLIAAVRGAVNLSDKWEWNSARDYWHELASVKGNYFNAGFTMLNLGLMRSYNMKEKWDRLSGRKFYYQDQDILNLTCAGKVRFLEARWNLMAYLSFDELNKFVEAGVYTQNEIKNAYNNPAVIHYAGDKPWNRYDAYRADAWWEFVKSDSVLYSLFDEKKARANHGPSVWFRIRRKIRRMLKLESELD